MGATPPRTSVADPLGEGDLHCLPIDQNLAYGPYPVGFSPAFNAMTHFWLLSLPGVGPGVFGYPLQGTGTGIVGTGTGPDGNSLPSPALDPSVGGSFNPPRCIIGQIYYDGVGGQGNLLNANTPVDTLGGTVPCPDPSNPHVFSGVSGSAADVAAGLPGVGTTPSGTAYTIPCHHGPIIDYTSGAF